jgi:glucosamine-6-phosphate isomerase
MKLTIASDFEDMSHAAAEDFIHRIERLSMPLVCLPSGKTPVAFLRYVREHYLRMKRQPDWFFVGLDEWVGVGPGEKGSCREFFDRHLFKALGVTEDRISFFNGLATDLQAECARMEAFIDSHKGIDVCVLGIGTNGHLGLNEPGSGRNFRTQVVDLTESTRVAAHDYFDEPRDLEKGVTLGLGTLLASRSVFLMASGESKAEVIRLVVEGPMDPAIPGTWLQEHPDCHVYLDQAAAGGLS